MPERSGFMPEYEYIAENIKNIRKNIDEAAKHVGRDPKEILLLAVSKTVEVPKIKAAVAEGLDELGENRVQEIMEKYEPMGPEVKWHLIGHLQTNKVKYIIDKVELIHSVNSIKLLEEINKRAFYINKTIPILLEINIAKEISKCGLLEENLPNILENIHEFKNIQLNGLMCVAPFVEKPEQNRKYFRKMRNLFVDIQGKNKDNINMKYLSMGMTNDYNIAIEEGANIVRIGTGIFGERNY